jgi:NAD(P)-dependent dehydrogenase (short-subunit alcohol dehydrogenase family)
MGRSDGEIASRQSGCYFGCREWHRSGLRRTPCARWRSHRHRRSTSRNRYRKIGRESRQKRSLVSNCDVSSETSVNALAAEVTARFGRCDILINCAGIYPLQPFAEITFAEWRRVQAINLDSVFLMCAAFVPGMRTRKWGRIVNLASYRGCRERV